MVTAERCTSATSCCSPRARRYPDGAPAAHGEDTTFREHAIPDDLSSPALTFPRHKGDRLMAAMQSMLVGEDLADAVRLARFGLMPAR